MYKSTLNGDRISFMDADGVPNVQIVVSKDSVNPSAAPVLEFKGKNSKPMRLKKTKPVKKTDIQTEGVVNVALDMSIESDFFINIDSESVENVNFINLRSGQIGSLVINSTVKLPSFVFKVNGFDTGISWLSGSTTIKTRPIDTGVTIYNYTVRKDVVGIWNINAISTEVSSVTEEEEVYVPVDDTQKSVHSFTYSSATQQMTLPSNVNTATIYAWGAGGTGGSGGYVQSTVNFPSLGQTIFFVIGRAGEGQVGGGATVVYYIDDTGRKRDILVAGGGGSHSSGGGIVGQGDLPGTQFSGAITPGYLYGTGMSDGSGGGYYAGVGGSGGSGYVGSNVTLEAFGVTQINHGTVSRHRDTNQRFDSNSQIGYTNTVAIDTASNVSDYYHTQANEEHHLGSTGQNGFAYLSYDIKTVTNTHGIDALTFEDGRITPSMATGSLSTHWKYFINETGTISESTVLTNTDAYEVKNIFGSKTMYAYATNEEGSDVFGNIRKIEISNNTFEENISVEFKSNTVTLHNVEGKTDPREFENGDHFLITVYDTYLENSFTFKTYDLPFTFTISHGTILEMYIHVVDVNSEKLTTPYFGTVRTSFEAQSLVPGITGVVTLPVTTDRAFELHSNENYTFNTSVLIVTLGSNDGYNWVIKSVTTTTTSKGSVEFDLKTHSDVNFTYIKIVTFKEPEAPASILSVQSDGMQYIVNKNIIMLGSTDNINWNVLSVTTSAHDIRTDSKVFNLQTLNTASYTYVKLVMLPLPPEAETLMSIESTTFDFATDKKTVIMGSNDNLNWNILSVTDTDINANHTNIDITSFDANAYRYIKPFRIST
jgi:hypothetical protein